MLSGMFSLQSFVCSKVKIIFLKIFSCIFPLLVFMQSNNAEFSSCLREWLKCQDSNTKAFLNGGNVVFPSVIRREFMNSLSNFVETFLPTNTTHCRRKFFQTIELVLSLEGLHCPFNSSVTDPRRVVSLL
jgi:hypothetical protein